MKYEVISMSPKDSFDEVATVAVMPRWYEKIDLFSKPKEEYTARYYGSGHQWWEVGTDKRADVWVSDALYEYWRDEMNRRVSK